MGFVPVNKKLMAALQREYGVEKGTTVYYQMEAKARKEHQEHPWTTTAQAQRIAYDHLRRRKA
jgi:hypothetical protein